MLNIYKVCKYVHLIPDQFCTHFFLLKSCYIQFAEILCNITDKFAFNIRRYEIDLHQQLQQLWFIINFSCLLEFFHVLCCKILILFEPCGF